MSDGGVNGLDTVAGRRERRRRAGIAAGAAVAVAALVFAVLRFDPEEPDQQVVTFSPSTTSTVTSTERPTTTVAPAPPTTGAPATTVPTVPSTATPTTRRTTPTSQPTPAGWRVAAAGLDRSSYLNDVSFPTPDRGWAVGSAGIIVATRDGGSTWARQTSGVAVELSAVAFADTSRGVAVGYGGVIVTTTDGGATWRAAPAPAGDYLAVSFPDRTHAWAAGNGGLVVATADGGATWTVQRPASTSENPITDVEFVDAEHGWAAGMGGRLLRTTDGGRNWARSALPGAIYDLGFLDAQRGWAVGGGLVLATTDGGLAWETRLDMGFDTMSLLGVRFVSPDQGWAIGISRSGAEQGLVMVTSDGGRGWTRVDPGREGILRGLAVADATHVWAVGTDVLTNTQP